MSWIKIFSLIAALITLGLWAADALWLRGNKRRFCLIPAEYWFPLLVAAWTIGVPTWFMLEYSASEFNNYNNPPGFENFKYLQDLVSKAWVAGIAVLGIYLKETREGDTKKDSETDPVKLAEKAALTAEEASKVAAAAAIAAQEAVKATQARLELAIAEAKAFQLAQSLAVQPPPPTA
jgi:hypothetical protein